MSRCTYACEYYKVPADIGRRVTIDGKPGIIAEDRGNYIGVLFDDAKPNDIRPCHPAWKVEYGRMGKVRRMTAGQQRYRRYLNSEFNGTFFEFIKYEEMKP